MCSVHEFSDELVDLDRCKTEAGTADGVGDFTLCSKCEVQNKAVVLVHGNGPMCRPCFEVYCNHKFRSTIGKSKKLKPGVKVLIAYSGGLCSSAMVALTKKTLEDSGNKRIKLNPAILHIHETFVTNSKMENKPKSDAILKDLNWPIFLTSLEMALRETDDQQFYWEQSLANVISDQSRTDKLKCILMKSLNNTKSLSAKLDYLRLLKMQLIIDVAKDAEFDIVFCGNSCDGLAVELLCDIAMGRGSQISCDTSFYDARHQVPICRPLREFMKRELVFYNHLNNVAYEVQPSLTTKTDSRMSIQRLTETFVCGLQENFPSTVHTIFKTGGKVKPVSDDLQLQNCIMCKSKLDNKDPDLCSALELLSLSSELSRKKEIATYSCQNRGSLSSPSSCCCEEEDSSERHGRCSSLDRNQNVMSFLCHGCQITVGEMGLSRNMQPELAKMLTREINRLKMKEEIKDFLLED